MIDAKTWMGAVEKSYQFYAYVFTLYVILMGVMRWYGQTTWYKREQARRAERELPVASLVSNADTERGFSYSALFRGGLTGIRIVAGLLGWVVAMHIFSIFEDGLTSTSSDWFWTGISILMFFPITTGIIHVAMLVFTHKDHLRLLDYVRPTVIVVLSLIGTVAAVWTIQDKQIVVICQLVAVFVISLLISYLIGAGDGISAADPTRKCPLVDVELLNGKIFDRVWLYERTDSDYRFVSANGCNHIVPAANVLKIRNVASPTDNS